MQDDIIYKLKPTDKKSLSNTELSIINDLDDLYNKEYKRHKNGGGWVHNDSVVNEESFISYKSVVHSGSYIHHNVEIHNENYVGAIFKKPTIVLEDVIMSGKYSRINGDNVCIVGSINNKIIIKSNCTVSGDCFIYYEENENDSLILSNCYINSGYISGGIWDKSPIILTINNFIIGVSNINYKKEDFYERYMFYIFDNFDGPINRFSDIIPFTPELFNINLFSEELKIRSYRHIIFNKDIKELHDGLIMFIKFYQNLDLRNTLTI